MNDIQRLRLQNTLGGGDYGLNYGMDSSSGGQQGPDYPFDGGQQQEEIGPDYPFSGGTTIKPPAPNIPAPTAPTVTPPDNAARLKVMLDAINQGYTPETTERDRVRKLLDSVPERNKPSLLRAIVAGGLSLKAEDPVKTAESVMYAPYYRDMAAWKEKTDPFLKALERENTSNVNERTLVTNAVTAETQADRLAEQARQADLKNEQALGRNRIAMIKTQMGPGYEMDAHNGTTIKIFNKATGDFRDTGVSTKWMDEADKVDAEGKYKVEAAQAAAGAANARGTIPLEVTLPDGTKTTIAWTPAGNTTAPIKVDGQPVTGATKVGTPGQESQLTAGTRAMMEGAQMLLPHVPQLRAQAADLNKRGLFGPVMSRVRNLAAKIGTTGTPEEVEQSLNDFSTALANDPLINQSNDEAVGQFITALGLMASGMGRVHGQARGGGSIQMITYMKSLLSAESSLDMFNGRMNTVNDYLQGYAVGPGGKTVTEKKPVNPVVAPRYQQDPTTGKKRVSRDGGKTWSPYP